MFEKLLTRISNALRKNKIRYMVIGGQAVLIYGEPRLTRDIDITLDASIDKLHKILEITKKLNLKPLVKDIEGFVKDTYVLPLIDKSGIRVDFIFSWTPYEKGAIRRAKKVKIGKVYVNFASPEDVIILKIISGRERDFEDVKTILKNKRKIDFDYILKWLNEFEKTLNKNLIKKFDKIKREVII